MRLPVRGQSDSRRTRRKHQSGFLIYLLGIPAVAASCCFGAQLYNVFLGEQTARGLMPPAYPGSVLINVEQERHPNTRFEYRTYTTPDDLATVLAYMEQRMPGFTKYSDERYGNRIEDTGIPSLITAASGPLNVLESGVPGVEVELDDAETVGTEIKVTLNWPDP